MASTVCAERASDEADAPPTSTIHHESRSNLMPSTITPFRIEIPDAAVEDLRSRLRNARFSEPLPGDGWDTGVPNSVLRTTVGLWSAHDWRATETRLNRLPQLTTRIN